MKPSIKKISELTGFSPATVSNALNQKRGVNHETAAEILRAAKELGYYATAKSKRITLIIHKHNGVIIDDTPFFPLLISGIEKECRLHQYELNICTLDKRDPDFADQVNAVLNSPVSGIILLGTELMDGELDIYSQRRCPLMTLDYWDEQMRYNGVLINNEDSVKMAVEYLIRCGHREIGHLRGAFRIKAFEAREKSYQYTLAENNVPIDSRYTFTLSPTINGAYKDMRKLLASSPKLPTAFFADNDVIAIGSIRALQECGYHVPDDVSVIGFDNLPFSEILSPRLTTIQVFKQDMGQIAVKMMIEELTTGLEIKTKTQVSTKFIPGNSVKNLSEKP